MALAGPDSQFAYSRTHGGGFPGGQRKARIPGRCRSRIVGERGASPDISGLERRPAFKEQGTFGERDLALYRGTADWLGQALAAQPGRRENRRAIEARHIGGWLRRRGGGPLSGWRVGRRPIARTSCGA